MGLTAADVSNDVCTCGSKAIIDDVTQGVFAFWWKPVTVVFGSGTRRLLIKNPLTVELTATPLIRWLHNRGAQNLNINTAPTNVPNLTAGNISFLAFRWDAAATNTDQQLWCGDLSHRIEQPSSYNVQQVGSGAFTTDAASDLRMFGNGPSSADSVPATWYWAGWWNRYLTVQEIETIRQSFLPGARSRGPHLVPSCIFWMPFGQNGANQIQRDYSGQGNHGTVTSATFASDHPFSWM